MRGAIPPLPNTPSWRGTLWKKRHRDNFTLFTFTKCVTWCIAYGITLRSVLPCKTVEVWSWPLSSMQCWSKECVEIYIYYPIHFIAWCLSSRHLSILGVRISLSAECLRAGWWGFDYRLEQRFLSSPRQFWGPPTHLCYRYWDIFPRGLSG
jgi:hypothetical protein